VGVAWAECVIVKQPIVRDSLLKGPR
jgi:hypothetical protein